MPTWPPISRRCRRNGQRLTVKQHLKAIRMLYDWLVTGQVMASNSGACGPGTALFGEQGIHAGAVLGRSNGAA